MSTNGPVSGTATYSVNADCTGAWSEHFTSPTVDVTNDFTFVVLDGGAAIRMAGTDPGLSVSFSLKLLP